MQNLRKSCWPVCEI